MKKLILKYMNHSVTLNQNLINSYAIKYDYVEIVTGNEKFKIQFKNKYDLQYFDYYIFEKDKIELIFDGSICIKINNIK